MGEQDDFRKADARKADFRKADFRKADAAATRFARKDLTDEPDAEGHAMHSNYRDLKEDGGPLEDPEPDGATHAARREPGPGES